MNNKGELKIADFGLARYFRKVRFLLSRGTLVKLLPAAVWYMAAAAAEWQPQP